MREKSRPRAFQWSMAGRLLEHLHLADDLVEAGVAHLGEQQPDLFSKVEEEVDDVLGRTLETLAQHRILRRHADRAGVQVALAHHDAAGRDQRGRREAELVGAEQGADHDVAARAQAAVDLQRDPAAQAVAHQRLVGFRQSHLPRAAGVLERRQRRSTGSTIIAGDGDVVGARLGDARRDRTYAHFRDQLHRDVGRGVDVLQIVDQLRQILDRIDVVVRRRRDQADAGRRMPRLGDGRVDLVAGQLAALAGLGALRDLDLDDIRVDQVLGRHAETARGNLLDRRAFRVGPAAGQRQVAIRLLASLARVRLAADGVHGPRQGRVRLARDRTERHRPRREPLDDLGRRFDSVERDRGPAAFLGLPDAEQPADRD